MFHKQGKSNKTRFDMLSHKLMHLKIPYCPFLSLCVYVCLGQRLCDRFYWMESKRSSHDVLFFNVQWFRHDMHCQSIRSYSYGSHESRKHQNVQWILGLCHQACAKGRNLVLLERIYPHLGPLRTYCNVATCHY